MVCVLKIRTSDAGDAAKAEDEDDDDVPGEC